MTLVKYSPRKPLVSIFDDMDRMFNQILGNGAQIEDENHWVPVFDARESEDEFILTADLPGITKKEIDINMSENVLTVSGERKSEKKNENHNWYFSEIQYGSFSRSFNLPENVNEEKIAAKFKNGVLTLTIPKTTPITPEVKKIAIS